MASSVAAPQSAAQQKLILQMAQRASNGKEVLLALRAAAGVFSAAAAGRGSEARVRAVATAKMMSMGTLDQLIEYAMSYPVDAQSTRPFIERIFSLADSQTDARTWYRIKMAAFHLKVGDLERQAQAKGDQLARK